MQLRDFSDGVQRSIQQIQDEVNRTQVGIQCLIEGTRSEGTSSVFRFGQERDRQFVDPRDYKIEVFPAQLSLGVWKTWKHEVEIFTDTIGPSWRGVKLVLQQARQSAMPLAPTVSSMSEIFGKAELANAGVEPFDAVLVDYPAKASTCYRMLVLKLNFDLSTEFRNSARIMVLSVGGFSTASSIWNSTLPTISGSMLGLIARPLSRRSSSSGQAPRFRA